MTPARQVSPAALRKSEAESPEAFYDGMSVVEGVIEVFAVDHPGCYFHPIVGEDRKVHLWCVHTDDSGHGCRFPSLLETLTHIVEVHAAGGNCGE